MASRFIVNTTFYHPFTRRSANAVALLAAFAVSQSAAQAPARPDRILTIAELRACMKLEQANKQAAADILQEQEAFKRDQEAIKAEQSEVGLANEQLRARSNAILGERDAISALSTALAAKAQAAKTDAEKAEAEADRAKLLERNRLYEQDVASFNASQETQRTRVVALNARIDPINQRSRTVNDRVEPHKKQVETWREQCGNRRFREEDEIAIKKELAAGK